MYPTFFFRSSCKWVWGLILSVMAALLLLLILPAQASSRFAVSGYTITQWNIEDGLPHNLPLSIAQDSRGRLWIGTWEGVARFDGHAFSVFDHRNTGQADLSGSAALLAEADGSLLVGSSRGIYHRRHGQWELLHPDLKGVRSEVMVRKRDGSLWFASSDQLMGLLPDRSLQKVALGSGPVQVFGMVELANGQLLLGTENGLFHLDSGKVQPWAPGNVLAGTPVLHISDDTSGWLLSTTNGVWHLSKDNHLHPVGPRTRVDRAVRDKDGLIWLNLHQGDLVRMNAQGGLTHFPLDGLRARTIFIDREGALWGGTTQGLFKISRGVAEALPDADGYVRAVLEDAQGTLWIGHSQGLRRVAGDSVQEVLQGSVLALARAADGNGIWAGTYDRGVIHVDRHGRIRERILTSQGRTYGLVRSLLQTADGTVWIGTGAMGLLRWRNGGLEKVGDENTLPMRLVQVLYADPAGGVLVGSDTGMAQVSEDGSIRYWAPETALPANSVFDFLRDPDGTLWIASDGGLLRKRGEDMVVFDSRVGLPRKKIFRLLDDGRHFWLSSTRGVFRVSRDDLADVADGRRHYLSVAVVDHTDGIPGGQGNGGSWPAGWRTDDGRLLFPTADGVGSVDARRVASRQLEAVPIELERVLVDGVSMDPQGGLHVSPDTRRLAFTFTGLSYQAPERVRYRYRLVGFDPEWIEAGAIGQAVFTNLPAGSYQFQMEAMSLPVDWDARARVGSKSFEVVVDAPLWQHPGVVLLAVGALLALLYGLMWLRMLTYRRRQQLLNSIIDERTDELLEKNLALESTGHERDALVRKLAYLANHDALTELPNRRAGDEYLQNALARAQKTGAGLCVALLDVDWFKRVNDQRGHEAGDRLLCHLARALEGSDCGTIFAARHGGEEFLLVLDGIALPVALYRMERLRNEIEQRPVVMADGSKFHYTVSIGVAAFGPQQDISLTLLAAADANLYQAKRAGRNRVVG